MKKKIDATAEFVEEVKKTAATIDDLFFRYSGDTSINTEAIRFLSKARISLTQAVLVSGD